MTCKKDPCEGGHQDADWKKMYTEDTTNMHIANNEQVLLKLHLYGSVKTEASNKNITFCNNLLEGMWETAEGRFYGLMRQNCTRLNLFSRNTMKMRLIVIYVND